MTTRTSSHDRILAGAIRLFSERGFRETTVGDIEHAAGLTRRAGGFYRHFKSKEDVLFRAFERMAAEMIAEISVNEVISLKAPRAELILIARSLLRHADTHRPLRLLIQTEGRRNPALRRAARQANAKLAALDVVPWVEHALRRSAASRRNARELALIIFGPIIAYLLTVDRGDPAFGLKNDAFLERWADHWAGWFARGARD
jgi:AcrR family transcriptional regulator